MEWAAISCPSLCIFCTAEELEYLCDTKNVALMSQPFGFLRCLLKISLYRSILLLLIASSKVMVTIWGTRSQRSFSGQRSPGTCVPSSEQKQSGSLQIVLSHFGARFGSDSISQAFSSEPSLQSLTPLQKRPRSMQLPSPQASQFSCGHSGSSVTNSGFTFFSLVSLSQFFTAHFQSQVCFSRSKASPGGHRIACRPAAGHWMTSLQASLPAFRRKSSPELLSSQSFFSCESSSSSWPNTPDSVTINVIQLNEFILQV